MTIRILFVGNSFVSRNDVPGLVRDLAASADRPSATAAIVAGGASLRRHLNAGTVVRALSESSWDLVVLQEQSTLPIKNPRRYHENVRAMAALVAAAGAEPVLYMTWARRAAPESQQLLTAAVEAIGKEVGARVAPVGLAWSAVARSHPDIGLYAADGSHPTAAGSLLAAFVLYGVIFRDPGLQVAVPPRLKIPAGVAATLLEAARACLS
jgi:hypothetical protein